MRLTKRGAVVGAALVLACASATDARAATGICVREAGFGQEWELKLLSCSGIDCLIEMDRTGFFPIPSAGAARFDPNIWRFTWNGNFAGPTQGTLQYACEFNPTGSLPYIGTGMVQRNANFTGGTAEHIVGQCALYRCGFPPSAAGDEADKATQP